MEDVPLSAIFVVSVLGIVSLAVLLLAAARLRRGVSILPPVEEPVPEPQRGAKTLVAVWLGIQLLSMALAPIPDTPELTLEAVQTDCLFKTVLFLAVLVSLTSEGGPTLKDFGFHLQNRGTQISEGVLGFFASIVPVMAAWLLTLPWRTETRQHGLLQLLAEDRSMQTVIWIVLAAVILAPIVEELIYRVVLQTWLQQIAPPREALICVAILFSAVHRLPDAVPLLPLALILGYVYQQRRHFLSVVLIHMLFNAVNLVLALLTFPSPDGG